MNAKFYKVDLCWASKGENHTQGQYPDFMIN